MQNLLISFAWLFAAGAGNAVAETLTNAPFDDVILPHATIQSPHSPHRMLSGPEKYDGPEDDLSSLGMIDNNVDSADDSATDFLMPGEPAAHPMLSNGSIEHTGLLIPNIQPLSLKQFARSLARNHPSTTTVAMQPSLELSAWILAGLGLTAFMSRRRIISEKFA